MAKLAIIGGTGFTSLRSLELTKREMTNTPFGVPSGPLTFGRMAGHDVVFLARHGYGHTIPPHKVNFRANLWALHDAGVTEVIAVASVGGIREDMTPGKLCFPDQIIDYTWGREHTYFESDLAAVTHIDFTDPYCASLRELLIRAAADSNLDTCEYGVYGATQGPRLETAAEINRLERDGCDMVGMTGMPETALARELGLCYATCAVVANRAAGRGDGPISMSEIETHLKNGMKNVCTLLERVVTLL